MRQVTKIRAEDVEKLRRELSDVPPPTDHELSRKRAIESLAPQLRELLTKGHSFRSLADVLSQRGLPINPMLLASYLRDAPSDGNVPTRKDVRVRARRKEHTVRTRSNVLAGAKDATARDSATVDAPIAAVSQSQPIARESQRGAAGVVQESALPVQETGASMREEFGGSTAPAGTTQGKARAETERPPRVVSSPARATFQPRKDSDDI